MSYPTITYGHGFSDDYLLTSDWAETEVGLACTPTNPYNDYLKLVGTCDNVADEYAYYEYDLPVDKSTSTYTKALVRWMTDKASNGCEARVDFVFTVGTQSESLGYSQTWETTSIDLTAGKSIDKIRLFIDDNPNNCPNGDYEVWFDFIMVYMGTFTFPKCYVQLYLPETRLASQAPPGKDGLNLQNLGSEPVRVHLWGEMTHESTWGSPKGQYLYQISHEMSSNLFQWFTWPSQGLEFKVTFEQAPQIIYEKDRLFFDLWLKEWKPASAAAVETYQERFGLV